MIQLLDKTGPQTLKYLTSTNDKLDKVGARMDQIFADNGTTADKFWEESFENAKKWASNLTPK
jgi:hypothetical protein